MTAPPIPLAPSTETVVRLLGPLEFSTGPPPTAAKLMHAAALLAYNAGQLTSRAQFLSELWHGTPPRSGEQCIQSYVYLLRHSGLTIEARQRGYMLVCPPLDVDAHRFVHYVKMARQDVAAGRFAAADDLLRAAESLWRGQPLEDVDCGGTLTEWVAALGDAYRTARRLRIELGLLSGHHREVLDELRADLRASDWCREDVAELLMVALYRSQRRVEALNVYRTVREALAEEHGLDPCSGLQLLQQQILAGDPALELNGEH